MIEPKLYKVKDNVPEKRFLSNKFLSRSDFYKLRTPLYKNLIFLEVFVNKEDNYLVTTVLDVNAENSYAPFYNHGLRHNNLVAETVIYNYNKVMDNLIKANILEYEEEPK